ncbi:hypothetical protein [Streptomyces millisiae]|uniref:Integral membrane protein n=1 Tax=Streptomyces millisiae TaxID=3075542 RepID=A0ABU2LSP3_9ACTN|nr:hypothetical protein [Streptomyces sp. DSM 44918]MDT0320614.1 hypothetical protein [Streptomyces sp. DSM 44918]
MAIAALITWLITALGGIYMFGTWLARGGTRSGRSRLPAPVILGHVALAVTGLVLWIIYLIADTRALAWVAFVVLLPVALLGFTMLARWLPVHREHAAAHDELAERHFPVPVVRVHGLFAVATVVLVFLTAIGLG